MKPLALLGALLLAPAAHAQSLPIEQGIRFTLKPRAFPMTRPLPGRFAGRIESLAPLVFDDRAHALDIAVQRRTLRATAMADPAIRAPSSLLRIQPRSRFTRFLLEDRFALGDGIDAVLGWQGMKISNRHANIAIGAGDDGLRARDWFLPRAAVHVGMGSSLALTLGYDESLRAYGDIGTFGPLGLSVPDFRALRDRLRPERQARTRLTAHWTPTPAIDLALHGYAGQLHDRLSFIEHGYLPMNGGSARITGAALSARHRLSPHFAWSLRYAHANLNHARERSLAAEATWQTGPWHAVVRATHASVPALTAYRPRPLRVEAGIDYAATTLLGRALRLSARLTDPDRLASGSFLRDDPSGPVRIADQTRGIALGATIDW